MRLYVGKYKTWHSLIRTFRASSNAIRCSSLNFFKFGFNEYAIFRQM